MEEAVRLNKYLSNAGICSRREADRKIEAGRITIEGRTATMGDKVTKGMKICIDGVPIQEEEEKIFLAYHKPRGVVCTTTKKEKMNIVDYINYPKRIYPIGRLDKESEGLIFLTNQGELVNQILRSRYEHEKEYEVTVDQEISLEILKAMERGVPILDTITKPCRIQKTGKSSFRIVITQGLNRQIRRMCEHFGFRVTHLVRIRILNVRLGTLKSGEYRRLTKREEAELKKQLLGEEREKEKKSQTAEKIKKKTSKRETSKRETSKRETSKREMSKRETSKREMSKREMSKREMSKREIRKREIRKREARKGKIKKEES